MWQWIKRYAKWLHTRWPAGVVEKLPQGDENGVSNVPGLYVVGDLTGIPLLKFSADTGARAVEQILADGDFQKLRERETDGDVLDLAIVGGPLASYQAEMVLLLSDMLPLVKVIREVRIIPLPPLSPIPATKQLASILQRQTTAHAHLPKCPQSREWAAPELRAQSCTARPWLRRRQLPEGRAGHPQ